VTFAAIVGVSCLREIWMSGMGPAGVLDYAARQYITNLRGLGEIYAAMLLLEGIALLFFAARQSCEQKDFGVRLIRTIVISSVAAASFNFLFFAGELMETGEPWARLKDFFLNQRWSSHVGDVNAAGSYFAMTTVIALGLFLLGSKHRLAWLVAGAMTGLALWMTASRTALIAVLALAAVYVVRLAAARSVATTRKVVIGTVLAIALAAFGVLYSVADTPGATSSTAVSIRWMFLQTTGRMLQAHPFAGVGIGQYGRWSAVFSSPELKAYYPRENAHNNFAQIAGELGLPGFTAFLAVIGFALFAPTRQLFSLSVAGIAAAALVVFMISWLGGHPLLVAEVSYPFWLILGVAAGTSTPTREATQGWT
jgi:O-antigen ligase